MNYPWRNLVFEGGGVKGIAYVGALSVLEGEWIMTQVERVGGTSAGAITATLVALGYTADEIHGIMKGLDFRRLMDDDWGKLRDTGRLLCEYGWY